MLRNIVLRQRSNLLMIPLRLALHWQFHAGFAGGASSCERLERAVSLGEYLLCGCDGEEGFADLEECSELCKGPLPSSLGQLDIS